MKIQVKLNFSGVATVELPDDINEDDAKIIAEKLALARILATFDNPDCGNCEEGAFEYVADELGYHENALEVIFDSSKTEDICGTWTIEK